MTPHIQLDKSFLYLASLARALGPAQLFPAKYLYPDANLGTLADAPAPIFADLLPLTGGFAFPVVDCEPDPWRFLARLGSDRFYGYPFSHVANPHHDSTLEHVVRGRMLLPDGREVQSRKTQSVIFGTLNPALNAELQLDREAFEDATGLLRGTCTHDGLPFQLPVPMQSKVYALIVTHWVMELDSPGDLGSYTLRTRHAAISGFHYYQRVMPYYAHFMELVNAIIQEPDFAVYPLSNHLTHSWLGGNLQISNQGSESEHRFGASLMRHFYHQQMDWQTGVINLMNHLSFRTGRRTNGLIPKPAHELEKSVGLDGLAFHQMHRMLRFDSHLFPRATQRSSVWPKLHPGWIELDRDVMTESLPRI